MIFVTCQHLQALTRLLAVIPFCTHHAKQASQHQVDMLVGG